eukprot:scaffold17239_cov20-Prasinocladus_malaysianus.AAC.3
MAETATSSFSIVPEKREMNKFWSVQSMRVHDSTMMLARQTTVALKRLDPTRDNIYVTMTV